MRLSRLVANIPNKQSIKGCIPNSLISTSFNIYVTKQWNLMAKQGDKIDKWLLLDIYSVLQMSYMYFFIVWKGSWFWLELQIILTAIFFVDIYSVMHTELGSLLQNFKIYENIFKDICALLNATRNTVNIYTGLGLYRYLWLLAMAHYYKCCTLKYLFNVQSFLLLHTILGLFLSVGTAPKSLKQKVNITLSAAVIFLWKYGELYQEKNKE